MQENRNGSRCIKGLHVSRILIHLLEALLKDNSTYRLDLHNDDNLQEFQQYLRLYRQLNWFDRDDHSDKLLNSYDIQYTGQG